MCGIAGYFLRESVGGRWADELPAAVAALTHRGPDDSGQWVAEEGRVGMGQRRLSIQDLSEHGHQPMFSHCGRWVMVFNGEVYNFKEIRPELEALGHRFSGGSDSEVILAAITQWGLPAVQRFIGMFAIALWSIDERKFYLIRDRLGVKPLYYGLTDQALFFGSELKALRAFTGWQPRIDRDALIDYFRYSYINAPRTIYQGVHKLEPGHWLEIAPGQAPRIERYWSVLDAAAKPRQGDEEVLADELESLMVSAFNYRMIADVPVGVFLSGGIDSSVLAAILQKHGGQRIKTFTIGFDEAEKNEAPFAEAVAKHLGTEQHTRVLKVEQAMALVPQWGDLYDEPFGDSSGIPTLLVSQIAAEQVKVVLSADGGDELFCGYNNYQGITDQMARRSRYPRWVQQAAAGALGVVPWDAMDEMLAPVNQPSRWNQRLRYATTVRFSKIRDRLATPDIGAMFDQALSQAYWPDRDLARLMGPVSPTRRNADSYPGQGAERLCLWDLHNYLPGDVLCKVDRATMRASIEGRDPMIDHRLVEFAFSLPMHMRVGALGPKHLLRKVLYRHVPRALIDRPKRGFGIPLGKWLRGGMRGLVDTYLNETRIRQQGLFDPAFVRHMVARLDAGDMLVDSRVWLLVAFQMWHQRWMEGSAAPAQPLPQAQAQKPSTVKPAAAVAAG